MRVLVTKSAAKDLEKLSAQAAVRIQAAVHNLANYPHVAGVKALKGKLRGIYRVRVGVHRILFTVADDVLTVTSIDDRKEAY
ncbi:MAG: type II toxin-antitoxin system RelE/ParE family toxin [Polyangiaceae bacterium]|nr:type II toxin-antitoxin system RelE/ParE family toxin [Polyangiaceae bacterium]